MHKVCSGYLLLMTLVLSTAFAPTLRLARSPGEMTAALQREYAEEGEIKRFQVDESYLPNLDVSLPELFDWSDIDRAYLAHTVISDEAADFATSSQPLGLAGLHLAGRNKNRSG